MSTQGWSENQRTHFDGRAADYRDMYGAETPFHDAMTARLLALARASPGLRVLDVGCGPGRTTVPLIRAGCLVTGLDISGAGLDLLLERLTSLGLRDRFEPLCQPAESLDAQRCYDLVIGRGLLHHLDDPLEVLRRVGRALVPGGRAAFMDPNPLQPAWIPFITFHPTLSWSIEAHVLRHTPRYNRRLFSAAGLGPAMIHYAGLVPPPLWGRMPWVDPLEDSATRLPAVRLLALYQIVIAAL